MIWLLFFMLVTQIVMLFCLDGVSQRLANLEQIGELTKQLHESADTLQKSIDQNTPGK